MDSDDDIPLSSQAKRRKLSHRVKENRNSSEPKMSPADQNIIQSLEVNTDNEMVPTFNTKEEIDLTIKKIKRNLITMTDTAHRKIEETKATMDYLRNDLMIEEAEWVEMREKIKHKEAIIETMKTILSDLEDEQRKAEAGGPVFKQTLAEATIDIESIETLEDKTVNCLQQTSFDGKEAMIINAVTPPLKKFLLKYKDIHGIKTSEINGNAAQPDRLDETTRQKMLSVIRGLRLHEHYWVFAHPVTEDIAEDYLDFISEPMDLTTIKTKLESEDYTSFADVLQDIRLIFDNCLTYNGRSGKYAKYAREFEQQIRVLMARRGLGGL
jgi:Bromodomain